MPRGAVWLNEADLQLWRSWVAISMDAREESARHSEAATEVFYQWDSQLCFRGLDEGTFRVGAVGVRRN